MKKQTLLFYLAIILLFSVTSCVNSKTDSPNSKSYNISDFSTLDLELVGEVYYEQTDSTYMTASGNSTIIDALKVVDNRGDLSIELRDKQKYSVAKKELIIRLGSPSLQSIHFNSIGKLYLKNHFESDKLYITNKGVGKIIIEDCRIDTFNLTSKSVGLIEVKGTTNQTIIHSEGVGKIDCSELKSKKAKVVSKGVGSLSVYAEESIDISITGIGNVNYYGKPKEVKTDISGIGKATSMDY